MEKYQISEREVSALKTVEDILIRLQKDYEETDVLMSETDGEVIKIDELARVRGILSFLKNNQAVVVNPSFN